MNNLIGLMIFVTNGHYMMLPVSKEFAAKMMDSWEKGEFDGKIIKGTCPVGSIRRWAIRGSEIKMVHTQELTHEMLVQIGAYQAPTSIGGVPPHASGM